MASTTSLKLKLLEAEDVQTLARARGPCVTMAVPGFHPGESAGTRAALLRQLAQKAAVELGKFSRSKASSETAASLEDLVKIVDEGHGGPGLTLFCAPDVQAVYITPHVTERITVGSHFRLVPVVRVAMAPHDICVLGLSQKHVHVWLADSNGVTEVPLPAGVPAGVEAAGAFDRPDHRLENRSAATSARKRGVRFGTSSDHDGANEYLHKFMLLVASGIHNAFQGLPVFLIGVREELLEFRRAAKDATIFEAEWHTNPEHCSLAAVEEHTRASANHEYYRRGDTAARDLPDARSLVLHNALGIIGAAREGRVHRLFVAEQAANTSEAPPETGIHTGEDLLNLAAVETLRTGGEVWTFPGSLLAAVGSPVYAIAAILRY